jgi:phage gp36-like protein
VAYTTIAQLKSRLGDTLYARLTDRINGAAADDSVGQQIVDEAEGLANAQLATRYATPIDLTAHPELADVLEARVLDLAEYLAWRNSPFVNDVPGRLLFLYEEASAWFTAIATGELNLPAASPPASRTAENDAPRFRAAPRKFTADELDGL